MRPVITPMQTLALFAHRSPTVGKAYWGFYNTLATPDATTTLITEYVNAGRGLSPSQMQLVISTLVIAHITPVAGYTIPSPANLSPLGQSLYFFKARTFPTDPLLLHDLPIKKALHLLRATSQDTQLPTGSALENALRQTLTQSGLPYPNHPIPQHVIDGINNTPFYLSDFVYKRYQLAQAISANPAVAALVQILLRIAEHASGQLHGSPAGWDAVLAAYADHIDPDLSAQANAASRAIKATTTAILPYAYSNHLRQSDAAVLAEALRMTTTILGTYNELWLNVARQVATCSDPAIPPSPQAIFQNFWQSLTKPRNHELDRHDLLPPPPELTAQQQVAITPQALTEEFVRSNIDPAYVAEVQAACTEADQSPLDAAIFFDETRRMNQKGVIAGLLDIQNRINTTTLLPERLRGDVVALMHSITSDELVYGGHNTLNLNLIEALYQLSGLPETTWKSYDDPRWLSFNAKRIRRLFTSSLYPTPEDQIVFALGAFLASEALASNIEFPAFQSHVASQLSILSSKQRAWVDVHANMVEERHAETSLDVVNRTLMALGRDPSTDTVLWLGFRHFQGLLQNFYRDQRRPATLPIIARPSSQSTP